MEKVSLSIQNGQPVVSSRKIAEDFDKEHKNIIRDIEVIVGQLKIEHTQGNDLESLTAQNCAVQKLFIKTEWQHEQNGQWYKEYLLTRDGFSLLVMGFTGAKALQWKLKYIEAFNKMEGMLKSNKPLTSLGEVVKMMKEVRLNMKEQGFTPREIAITIKQLCELHGVKLPNCFVKPEETTLNDIYDMIDFIFELPKSKRKDSTYDDYVVARTINLKLLK